MQSSCNKLRAHPRQVFQISHLNNNNNKSHTQHSPCQELYQITTTRPIFLGGPNSIWICSSMSNITWTQRGAIVLIYSVIVAGMVAAHPLGALPQQRWTLSQMWSTWTKRSCPNSIALAQPLVVLPHPSHFLLQKCQVLSIEQVWTPSSPQTTPHPL